MCLRSATSILFNKKKRSQGLTARCQIERQPAMAMSAINLIKSLGPSGLNYSYRGVSFSNVCNRLSTFANREMTIRERMQLTGKSQLENPIGPRMRTRTCTEKHQEVDMLKHSIFHLWLTCMTPNAGPHTSDCCGLRDWSQRLRSGGIQTWSIRKVIVQVVQIHRTHHR